VRARIFAAAFLAAAVSPGCTTRSHGPDATVPRDAPQSDAALFDAPSADAPMRPDAPIAIDAPLPRDAGRDAPLPRDAGRDAGRDARAPIDAPPDAPRPDAPACVRGVVMCTGGYPPSAYAGVCAAREMHIVGVYEPSPGSTTIPVSVTRTGAQLTIVVSSYEAVSWAFTLGPGVNVERVVLNGYDRHTVSGLPPTVPVLDRSGVGSYFAACAYEWPVGTGGCETERLVMGVESLFGIPTTSFTGCYQASTFSIADP
jgi:hypothetical protein